jgi:hypothetical protein
MANCTEMPSLQQYMDDIRKKITSIEDALKNLPYNKEKIQKEITKLQNQLSDLDPNSLKENISRNETMFDELKKQLADLQQKCPKSVPVQQPEQTTPTPLAILLKPSNVEENEDCSKKHVLERGPCMQKKANQTVEQQKQLPSRTIVNTISKIFEPVPAVPAAAPALTRAQSAALPPAAPPAAPVPPPAAPVPPPAAPVPPPAALVPPVPPPAAGAAATSAAPVQSAEDIPLSSVVPNTSAKFNELFTLSRNVPKAAGKKRKEAIAQLKTQIEAYEKEYTNITQKQREQLNDMKRMKEKYELIENEDEFYMAKYLKYKEKYLQLKQMLNN